MILLACLATILYSSDIIFKIITVEIIIFNLIVVQVCYI